MTDNKGRVANFKNTIIIMTSNMGSHLIQEKFENIKESIDSTMELTKQEVIGLLKQTMRPEFINRIDDIILFTPLSKDTIKSVVSLQIENVKKMLLRLSVLMIIKKLCMKKVRFKLTSKKEKRK